MENYLNNPIILFFMNWRENIDPSIRNHLEAQINETIRHRKSFSKSTRPTEAQLWVAIANLSKQILDLNIKIKFLEQIIQESLLKQQGSVVLKSSKPAKKPRKK
jgi:ABC-type molybdate transport system ATPase subunit